MSGHAEVVDGDDSDVLGPVITMRVAHRVVAGLVMLGMAACGQPFRDHTRGPIEGTLTVQTLDTPPPPPAAYHIQRGDQLSIRFYRNPELNIDLIVRPDGMISLPLINDVPAADSSPQELGRNLEELYKRELAVPDVTVIVTKFGGQRIYIGGEVTTPGELELPPGLTLYGAITKAGGFKNTARVNQIILIRKTASGKLGGTSLDLTEVHGGTHPERDVELQPYDIVVVPRSAVANVNTFMELYVTRNLPAGGIWLNFLAGVF
jgi:protein involved in polysaccharide export with SLBB domain